MAINPGKALAVRMHLEAALAILDESGPSVVAARIDHALQDLADAHEGAERDLIAQTGELNMVGDRQG